ncbi:uncharacterized protein LOC110860150 [Folsomia candida]|uniref:uncharacterized protein LOC110860150 n=1 Tax=Folsomia candida TaxID=158441 RepID=UPI000B900888|nr:uncharacterized protein LOC110860150 [Folsomia candida]
MAPNLKILIFGLLIFFSAFPYLTDAADCSQLYAKKCDAHLPHPTQVPVVSYDGDDAIYIFGGCRWTLSGPDVYSNEILKYTISTDTIQLVAHLPFGVYLGTLTADGLGNYFYFGGAIPGYNSHYVIKFNSYTNQVDIVNRIPYYFHYSASFAVDQSTAYVMAGNLFQEGVIKFDMQTYAWEQMADLPTKFRTAVAFWDKNKQAAYVFGQGNAAVSPPYDQVIHEPAPDYGQIYNFQIPDDYLNVPAVSNDETDGFVVGGFKPTESLFWFQMQSWTGKYCPVVGLPGGDDVLFSRTGIAFVPNLNRLYVFGGASQNLNNYLETTHDTIWVIDVDL